MEIWIVDGVVFIILYLVYLLRYNFIWLNILFNFFWSFDMVVSFVKKIIRLILDFFFIVVFLLSDLFYNIIKDY